LHASQNIFSGNNIKAYEMREAQDTYEGKEKCMWGFGEET